MLKQTWQSAFMLLQGAATAWQARPALAWGMVQRDHGQRPPYMLKLNRGCIASTAEDTYYFFSVSR
jgi:hypothetical protein